MKLFLWDPANWKLCSLEVELFSKNIAWCLLEVLSSYKTQGMFLFKFSKPQSTFKRRKLPTLNLTTYPSLYDGSFNHIYNIKEVNANMTVLVRQRFSYPGEQILRTHATQQSRGNWTIFTQNLPIALKAVPLSRSLFKQADNLGVNAKKCALYS